MHKKVLLLLSFLLISLTISAQKPQKLTSNQIYEKVQKLNFLGSALYIAAHPDDENTRLIAYLSNHEKARTGYLSLTRGDGGQNLIGPEMRELLGVIRTQELLAARNVDGGEQRFSRANDFGYSKHPDETLKIWDKDKVLADVVWAIRTFKPDVIINRFNHRTPGTTHGHHTSSAMLSVEAFDLANDKSKYPEQLKDTDTWRPNRLFFNTSWWFYGSEEAFEKADKSNMLSFDIGTYYPLKGLSNNEVAAIASSQHLCQGFGRLTTRGSQTEYVEFLKGEFPKDKKDIFSGINTTWNRVEGGGEIGDILYDIEQNFDFVNPSKHLPDLLEAYKKVRQLKDSHWRAIKTKELNEIIKACAGLYLEASAESSSSIPSSTINVNFEALNRSFISMELSSITILPEGKNIKKELDLAPNSKQNFKSKINIAKDVSYSSPYWLATQWDLGMYKVNDQKLIGNPESLRPIQIQYNIVIEDQPIAFTIPVVHRYAKRDKGEIYEPFEVLPKVTTKLLNKVLVFSSEKSQKVTVEVRSGAKNTNGIVTLKAPKGWKVTPNEAKFSIDQKGDIQLIDFMVTPTQNESEGVLKAIAKVEGKSYDKELIEINYSHIPKQSVLLPSQAKVVRMDIKKNGTRIGYIQGSGDAIPESLQQIGYEVTELNVNEINGNLEQFDAVVVGIRAYNTIKELQFKQKYLLEYVKNGGNLIVQYNTNRGVDVQAPYELQLSRDRVTDEHSKVTLLAKEHSILNYPNKITEADFDGWVQERGLYFPNKWSKEYTSILSMHDKGESVKKGSLLVAKYGKGNYIYTGLSFFRELPAGVSGAYKLFANLLSVKENTVEK
ncbi:N-acetylglucosaminyl deacetylase, LmbE family [Tenacibaculum mesophilum]|uniref:PIG-L family deacetylase n=1 Tax=Tenacibaculum mesophilum TaxID=104268 RepID=A0ABM7CDP6_9FLAO|nr:PIG-L family deacetylase [Tenacibaculum mesophilum]AZJ31842.1 PIG-L family deacetylase [Tenacibaculum mesophilum]QFS27097.1 LmbE family protein [Tenacibaculum mesophilum]SHF84704.1 N-acetylglucosaminyl deacetylase, LmbE family [Tenacibaculum mesophilum]